MSVFRGIRCGGVAFAIALMASPGWAHDLAFECTMRDTVVDLVAFYDDDTPCQQGLVKVYRDKTLIDSGKTDDRGRWSFARPAPGKYRVTVSDGAGHFFASPVIIRPPASADPTGDPSAEPVKVSEGPSRDSFTAVRWLGLGGGLVAIAGLAVAAHFLLRRGSTN